MENLLVSWEDSLRETWQTYEVFENFISVETLSLFPVWAIMNKVAIKICEYIFLFLLFYLKLRPLIGGKWGLKN